MTLSQKCQYAIRSLFELARSYGTGPIRISQIAERQAIPQRFLENILHELKSTDLIDSRRGPYGGYQLTRDPGSITVGEVIRLIDGPMDPVRCVGDSHTPCCPLKERCSLINLWNRAKASLEKVYDATTFADLVEEENQLNQTNTPNYCI